MKPTILFVDDEPNILRGLQRLFRAQRDIWNLEFVGGGQEAVNWLQDNDPYAIVTDMRMPSVDGGNLLSQAARMQRAELRLVLSGEADRQLTFNTVGTSHQFFSKPCDDRLLVRAITQAYLLGSDLLFAAQRKLISNLTSLPVSQRVNIALAEATGQKASLADLINIVASEPALAIRVLQLANSSYFGRPADTLSIAAGVKLLGKDVIRSIWEQNKLVSVTMDENVGQILDELSGHAVVTARRTFDLSRLNGAADKDCEDAYAIGLLSWVGDVIAAGMPAASGMFENKHMVAASSYISCIYGLPHRTTDSLEMLSKSPDLPAQGDARARELGAVLFENRRAA